MQPTFISLFAGCGGMDLGFLSAGYKSIAGFEIDPLAAQLRSKNVSNDTIIANLASTFRYDGLIEIADVVIAGPPCQGFSTIGKRSRGDERNKLLEAAIAISRYLLPKCVVIENVPGIAAPPFDQDWKAAANSLRQAGYSVVQFMLTSSDFGVAQHRKRAFTVACRRGPGYEPPTPTSRKTVQAAFASLPENDHAPLFLPTTSTAGYIASKLQAGQMLCDVRGSVSCVPSWAIPSVFGETTAGERELLVAIRKLRRTERKRDFGDADPVSRARLSAHLLRSPDADLASLQKKNYIKTVDDLYDLRRTFNGNYRRLNLDSVSSTVDSRFLSPSHFLHPIENRGLTLREAARLQGFPDTFQFEMKPHKAIKYVANAVPPPLAYAVALSLLGVLAVER